ncbi:hypothetical protein EON65_52810 [archaeon]|nr:MAG: hypothetical protein EON65_52810 [archaeon]
MLTGALAEAIVKEGVLECIYRSIHAYEQTGVYGDDPVSVEDIMVKVDKFYPPLPSSSPSNGSYDAAFVFDTEAGDVKFHMGL